ncbi:sensor domain-containing diguanylate cyclase [Vibrio albus]|nr:sensor domain-containing diguanylate cyclase [Vibrio albus]
MARLMRRKSLTYTILLLAFLFLVLAIIFFISQKNIIQRREIRQFEEVINMIDTVSHEVRSVGVDLLYYSQSDLAIATLSSQDGTAKAYLSSLLHKIGSIKNNYSQIRLLDVNGNEVIRFDRNADFKLHQVPSHKLQNKSNRYYFKNALNLKSGEVYTSKFDLNKEHGVVEQPIKPMLRFSTPIYNAQGVLVGVGVINYEGRHLLQMLEGLNEHEGDQLFVINEDGYYLKAYASHKEWSFMFPEGEQFLFYDDHPELWHSMQKFSKGKLTNSDGEYYFHHFELAPSETLSTINREGGFLVMHVPSNVIDDELSILIHGLGIGFILVAPLLVFLGLRLASSRSEQERLLNTLKYEANHDALTGLYNRKAIMDCLKTHVLLSHRRNSLLAVGFIDVNDLKVANDLYGHEAGDELIKGVGSAINMSIRESDCAARIGGDEFLVVFVDCNKHDANIIMQRIQSAYRLLGAQRGKHWDLSFGCSELGNENDDAEALVARADSVMYTHKTRMKSSYKSD